MEQRIPKVPRMPGIVPDVLVDYANGTSIDHRIDHDCPHCGKHLDYLSAAADGITNAPTDGFNITICRSCGEISRFINDNLRKLTVVEELIIPNNVRLELESVRKIIKECIDKLGE